MNYARLEGTQKLLAIAGAFLAAGILLVGCAKYRPTSFATPNSVVEKKNNISASAQLLSDGDCKRYFSRKIGKKGYKAVQIHIDNQSSQKIILDASTINMHVENKDYVASRLHIDMTPRVVGWGVAGLLACPLFWIPAAVEAVNVPKANKSLDADFDNRAIDANSRITINPQAKFNMVFFVRKENVTNELQFSVKEAKSKATTKFNLNIA